MEQIPEQHIRLSLRWILLAFLSMFVFGVLGGLAGMYVNKSPRIPLIPDRDQLVTTIQEVTISPSKSDTKLVEKFNRSVVVLARVSGQRMIPVGTGIIVTTDGLIVSTYDIIQGSVWMFDAGGKGVNIFRVGTDELYGLTYYRVPDQVVTPFELASDDPQVGARFLSLGRSSTTFTTQAHVTQLTEYAAPDASSPQGHQRLASIAGSGLSDSNPLLDDEGKVAAIVLDADAGKALPISALRHSLNRVTMNKREEDPFALYGLRLEYGFSMNKENTQSEFTPVITDIALGSPAAGSGLERGDVVVAINDKEVSWSTNIAEYISEELSLRISVKRDGQVYTMTLTTDQ